MEALDALQTLGITLPTPAYIFGAIVFGIAGIAFWRHGRVVGRPRRKWLGVALMFYPYLISSTWLLYAVGAALCVAAALDGG